MSWSNVTRTTITGLAASGTTDDLGTWNEDIDLDSFVTVPGGATGVILNISNTNSSTRWLGVRRPGDTTDIFLQDIARDLRWQICPLGAGNTIDLYTENASDTRFDILGFTGAETVFFDPDSFPTVASTSGSFANRDLSADVPSGAVAVIMASFAGKWRPTGESTSFTNANISGMPVIPLDAGRTADFETGSNEQILAYMTGGVAFATWLPAAETATNDNTWRAYPAENAAASFAFVVADKSSTGTFAIMRARDDATSPALPVQTTDECILVPTGTAGALDYRGEADTIAWRTMAWFTAADSAPALSLPHRIRAPNVLLRM